MALLDLWGNICLKPVFSLIGVERLPKPSFYTVGLDELSQMIESAQFGLKHTPYLKIKLNRDVTRCVTALRALKDLMEKSGKANWKVRCFHPNPKFKSKYDSLNELSLLLVPDISCQVLYRCKRRLDP